MNGPHAIPAPDERATARIAARVLGVAIVAVERFPTGRQHWVYAVRGADGSEAVIRLNRPDVGAIFAGAAAWNRLLRPLGVPLPALIAHDAAPTGDEYPYMLLERLPGRDLGAVYPTWHTEQKRARRTDRGDRRIGGRVDAGAGLWVRAQLRRSAASP